MRDHERLLVEPYPSGRVLVDRQPKARDDGIARLIQNVPVHGVSVVIMKNQADMIEADNSARDLATPESSASRSVRPAILRDSARTAS